MDCWAAGVILYMMLAGKPPFTADDPAGLVSAVLSQDADLQEHPWNNVSLDAKHLVAGLLNKDKATRVTAAEVLQHSWVVHGPGERTSSDPPLVSNKVCHAGTCRRHAPKLTHSKSMAPSKARIANSPKLVHSKSMAPPRARHDHSGSSPSSRLAPAPRATKAADEKTKPPIAA